jgi:tetratricopeptide (TPR) repeat protein
MLGAGPVNTLEHPVIEFYSLKDYATPATARQVKNLALLIDAREALGSTTLVQETRQRFTESWGASQLFLKSLLAIMNGTVNEQTLDRVRMALRAAPDNDALKFAGAQLYHASAGSALARLGDHPSAEQTAIILRQAQSFLQDAVALQPDDAQLRLALGTALQYTRRDLAVREWEKAVALNPGLIETRLLLAENYTTLGRSYAAFEEYEAILKLAPDNVAAKHRLGPLLTTSAARDAFPTMTFSDGLRLLQEAHDAAPQDPEIIDSYAMATFLQGQAHQAVALIDRAVQLAPDDQRIRETQRKIHAGTRTTQPASQ